jgi:hypothetical protein
VVRRVNSSSRFKQIQQAIEPHLSLQQTLYSKALFPQREPPKVVEFNLKKTYGRLLEMVEQAFSKEKPLFSLAIYYPLAYYKGPDTTIDPLKHGRQKEVVSLIRIQFLKRFESSARAFELSCAALMEKLLAWLIKHCQTDHEKHRLERWKNKYADLIGHCRDRQLELFGGDPGDEDDEDIVTPEILEAVEELSRDQYKVDEMIDEAIDDLHTIADFLQELQKFKVEHDDKLDRKPANSACATLIRCPAIRKHKGRPRRRPLFLCGSGSQDPDRPSKARLPLLVSMLRPNRNYSERPCKIVCWSRRKE